jgi:hypothetical protein
MISSQVIKDPIPQMTRIESLIAVAISLLPGYMDVPSPKVRSRSQHHATTDICIVTMIAMHKRWRNSFSAFCLFVLAKNKEVSACGDRSISSFNAAIAAIATKGDNEWLISSPHSVFRK